MKSANNAGICSLAASLDTLAGVAPMQLNLGRTYIFSAPAPGRDLERIGDVLAAAEWDHVCTGEGAESAGRTGAASLIANNRELLLGSASGDTTLRPPKDMSSAASSGARVSRAAWGRPAAPGSVCGGRVGEACVGAGHPTVAAIRAAQGDRLPALDAIRAAQTLPGGSAYRFWEGLFRVASRDFSGTGGVTASMPPGFHRETLVG